ncbi:MAG TPA: HAD family phosphatase [Flavobacteriales bacterium]|nr:HAD family phosphatase [Flavobacteriales bacterium]
MNVDTLILDLGGVLIDVDYRATARHFEKLGISGFDRLYSKAKQSDLFDRFETGELSPGGFRDEVRAILQTDLSDADIDAGWNAMLGTIPPARIELVRELKERYQLLLLSNTNAIHVPAFEAIIARDLGIGDFRSLFHGAYYSCELGKRKPNADIFHYVVAQHSADPARTLFIDDSIQHVIGARDTGLHAEHLELEKEDVVGMVNRLRMLL